jgi:hypothetical protein
VTAPYKNPAHAVADALMAALQGLTGAVGAVRARRAKASKDRQVAQALAVVEPRPVGIVTVPKLTIAERKEGYCWICGPTCTCGGAA